MTRFIIKGFTLTELLITVSIITILGGIGFASFVGSRNTRDLTTATQNVLSVLRLAQSKTIAGQNNSAWGVHLQSNQITLFQGDVFASSPLTRVYPLPNSIQLINISLAGAGSDIVFKRVTGETDTFGTFTMSVIASPTNWFSVIINNAGKAYQAAPPPAPSITRVVDTRHRSFVLGWSIQTATTMTLTFTNPSVTQPITMAPFFDAGQTKFDWSGTIPVGGRNQVLRIHTTSLTASNTTLSIDRDCRTNSAQLTIDIDGQTIATYSADCSTVTVGSFGGIISEP